MGDCKTGAEHIKSLKDGRTVYLDGQMIGDVTEHPAFRNAVHSAGALYDFQAQPDMLELMTFQPNGSNRRINRAWQMPRNYEEMVQPARHCRRGRRCRAAFLAVHPTISHLRWLVRSWASTCSAGTVSTVPKR